jgi:hypothetical protein
MDGDEREGDAMPRYNHTQQAARLRRNLIGGAAACVLLAFAVPAPPAILVGSAAVLVGCAFAFGSLTIRVDDRSLGWHFGPGLFRQVVPLAAIATAEATQTGWLDGWGIHRTRRGWLYNVSGFDAVLVTRKAGRPFLLGTDEAARLAAAIREAVRTAGGDSSAG